MRGADGVTRRSAVQDRLALSRSVLQRLVRGLVAVHRLAELLVEDRLDPGELRVRDGAGDTTLHQVDEPLENRLLLDDLVALEQRVQRREQRALSLVGP